MIQLTAEEYETLLRDAKRYRGMRRIFTDPVLAVGLADVAGKFTSIYEPTEANYDQLADMLLEQSGLTDKDLL